MSALLPPVCWPTIRMAVASKGFWKSCARLCSRLYASYSCSFCCLRFALLLRWYGCGRGGKGMKRG